MFDIQFTTPDTTKWAHFTFRLSTENETSWFIYEGATINTAGTTVAALNNDRNSANVSGMTVAQIGNTSVANANSDTAVAAATTIACGITGSGKTDGGVDDRNREIILKQDTVYCMRAVADSAGYVNFIANWYEHTNKG